MPDSSGCPCMLLNGSLRTKSKLFLKPMGYFCLSPSYPSMFFFFFSAQSAWCTKRTYNTPTTCALPALQPQCFPNIHIVFVFLFFSSFPPFFLLVTRSLAFLSSKALLLLYLLITNPYTPLIFLFFSFQCCPNSKVQLQVQHYSFYCPSFYSVFTFDIWFCHVCSFALCQKIIEKKKKKKKNTFKKPCNYVPNSVLWISNNVLTHFQVSYKNNNTNYQLNKSSNKIERPDIDAIGFNCVYTFLGTAKSIAKVWSWEDNSGILVMVQLRLACKCVELNKWGNGCSAVAGIQSTQVLMTCISFAFHCNPN